MDARPLPVSPCPLCAAASVILYDRLKDELCGTPGEWRLARCSRPACGLVFLDPRPGESEAASAYEQYYTHEEGTGDPAAEEVHGSVRLALHRLNLALLRASGATAEKRRVRLSYLGGVPAGRLLEVGCGSGWRLAEFRRLGWDVVGQEVDEKAAGHARKAHGLTVLAGPLDRLGLPDNSFDAVVMNHVIEHVREPVKLLAKCWRLVKPQGRLVCVTQNAGGLGHRFFGRRWSGLDTPRHLVVFTPRSMVGAAAQAGLRDPRCWTSAGDAFAFAFLSMYGHRTGSARPGRPSVLRARLLATLVQYVASAARVVAPSSGDECVLQAVK
jgi:2-polyprenyl-3-methyl-5-hydroxy-6-metoxy-1,4-benzoquinol methylase